MPARKPEGPYRDIPIGLIDPPSLPMRETFDPEKLSELTASILRVGVLQPLAVEQEGGRYRIDDGHRRFVAACNAGLLTVPAIVRDTTVISGEAVKCHTNAFREDVNPAEEAKYLSQLLEQECGGDVDRLCELTQQARSYVEGRLLLLQADPDVFEALRGRRISMAVARELNRVKDRGYRMMYLDAAIRGGATARIVQEWRIQSEAMTPAGAPAPTTGENQYSGLPAPITTMTCVCCQSSEEPWNMELIPVHRRCRGMFVDPLIGRLRGLMGAPQEGGDAGGPPAPRTQ